jgi:hypothetical protein
MRGRFVVLMPALALAMPACTSGTYPLPTDPPGLADPSQPGSVIVWPKFAQGSVGAYRGTAGAFAAARTVIELGAVCPAGQLCADNSVVRVHLHWICPPTTGTNWCPDTDFIVAITYGTSRAGKITFNPSQLAGEYNGTTTVPFAPCQRGFLIGYAVDNSDRPIKFDRLIGDAVQRNFGPGLQSASAITIQADPGLANLALITLDSSRGLVFDGQPGHYQMVTGQLQGDVSFDSDLVAPFHDGFLILLTLDVKSNLPNTPTVVALDFYNFNGQILSTTASFICWEQVQLSTGIDPNLTVGFVGSGHAKGLVGSGQALDATTGQQRTLLGLFQSTEGPAAGPANATESYAVRPGNNSVPIPTTFYPGF